MPKTKTTTRQLRLIIPVSEQEQKRVAQLAKADGVSVPDFVKRQIAERFKAMRATKRFKAKAKTARLKRSVNELRASVTGA